MPESLVSSALWSVKEEVNFVYVLLPNAPNEMGFEHAHSLAGAVAGR